MLGALIGDMVGSIHEGAASRGRHFTLFTPRSCFTDDTVLSLAIAHALRTGKPYDAALRHWARRYPAAGYGAGFTRWFEQDAAGPYNSFGNGSAMRVAPVAWALDDIDSAIAEAERSAAVTHNHPEGIRGACAIAAAIFAARTGASRDQIIELCASRFGYACRLSMAELEARDGFDASCQGTVPLAIAAFLHSKDFEDALRIAVSLGGDTDTLACIAGALAEAHYRDIPPPLQAEALRRLDVPLCEEMRLFAERFQLVHLAASYPDLHVPRSSEGPCNGVLVEATSVLVRVDAIHRRMKGGWRTFEAMAPGQTLCADPQLARVGFMSEGDAIAFARKLEGLGLEWLWKGQPVDIALADPVRGLRNACGWVELHDVKLTPTGSRIVAACVKGTSVTRIAVPEGWSFRHSLSGDFYFRLPREEGGPESPMYHVSGGPE